MIAIAILVTSATLIAQADASDPRAMSQQCEAKYRTELPAGAVAPVPNPPLRIGRQRERRLGYACVMATVEENGRVSEATLLETDWPGFGDYFVNLVKEARFRPATVDGKPFRHRMVVSASIN